MSPLAGKPPYATDEPDSMFAPSQTRQPRLRQNGPPDPNARTSAYNVYDSYISSRDSAADALGNKFMNMADDDDDDDDIDEKHAPIAAPRPGYPAPIAALNLARPAPAAAAAPPSALRAAGPPAPRPLLLGSPMAQSHPHSPTQRSPTVPHPLQPPLTPITPAFARPPKSPSPRENVAFTAKPIMRSGSEDGLLPSRGEKGDDFWRRFSMVVKQDQGKPYKSNWLQKTQSGTSRLSRWVWVIGVTLLICIIAAVVIGIRVSHNTPPNQAPKALGGSENEGATITAAVSGSGAQHTSLHVSPTNTVQRRAVPMPTAARRAHLNRTHVH